MSCRVDLLLQSETLQLLVPLGFQTHEVKAEHIRSIHHNMVLQYALACKTILFIDAGKVLLYDRLLRVQAFSYLRCGPKEFE